MHDEINIDEVLRSIHSDGHSASAALGCIRRQFRSAKQVMKPKPHLDPQRLHVCPNSDDALAMSFGA